MHAKKVRRALETTPPGPTSCYGTLRENNWRVDGASVLRPVWRDTADAKATEREREIRERERERHCVHERERTACVCESSCKRE